LAKTARVVVETGVLKDAMGLGLLLLIIASSQLASFVLGA